MTFLNQEDTHSTRSLGSSSSTTAKSRNEAAKARFSKWIRPSTQRSLSWEKHSSARWHRTSRTRSNLYHLYHHKPRLKKSSQWERKTTGEVNRIALVLTVSSSDNRDLNQPSSLRIRSLIPVVSRYRRTAAGLIKRLRSASTKQFSRINQRNLTGYLAELSVHMGSSLASRKIANLHLKAMWATSLCALI